MSDIEIFANISLCLLATSVGAVFLGGLVDIVTRAFYD